MDAPVKKKRWRGVNVKPGQLRAAYGRCDGDLDLVYAWGGEGAQKADSRILMRALEENPVFDGKTLVKELVERGYDITTLKFSIEKAGLVAK